MPNQKDEFEWVLELAPVKEMYPGALPLALQTFASPDLRPIPTMCPWVSEDETKEDLSKKKVSFFLTFKGLSNKQT